MTQINADLPYCTAIVNMETKHFHVLLFSEKKDTITMSFFQIYSRSVGVNNCVERLPIITLVDLDFSP